MHYMVVDASNLLFRTFHATAHNDDDSVGFAHHKNLRSLNKAFTAVNPDKVVVAFDRPNNWRKIHTTMNDDRVTPLVYKGHRRKAMTPKQKRVFEAFLESVGQFEQLLRDQTTILTLAQEGLEADDLIAGFVQHHPDDEHTIVSGDKDFIQLLRQSGVQLLDPDSGNYRTLDEWDGDADYFMFEKCFRGDSGDNVISARSGIRSTKIRKCYEDEYTRVQVLNETWKLDGVEYRVGDIFEENKLLMDLTAQPEGIRSLISDTITNEIARSKKFNYMAFLRFCGKHELKNIAKESERYVKLFST